MVKPSLPHHGPSVLERWHRSFHPPNPWYKWYRQLHCDSCSGSAGSFVFFSKHDYAFASKRSVSFVRSPNAKRPAEPGVWNRS